MSLVDNASSLAGRLTINLSVPAPPAFLVGLPVIGQPIERLWNLVTMNMATALQEVGPQLRLVATWLLAQYWLCRDEPGFALEQWDKLDRWLTGAKPPNPRLALFCDPRKREGRQSGDGLCAVPAYDADIIF